jgi:hypothetical protein
LSSISKKQRLQENVLDQDLVLTQKGDNTRF